MIIPHSNPVTQPRRFKKIRQIPVLCLHHIIKQTLAKIVQEYFCRRKLNQGQIQCLLLYNNQNVLLIKPKTLTFDIFHVMITNNNHITFLIHGQLCFNNQETGMVSRVEETLKRTYPAFYSVQQLYNTKINFSSKMTRVQLSKIVVENKTVVIMVRR